MCLLLVSGSPARGRLIRFTGEVSKDHEFRKEIGGGLVFVLVPTTMDPGAISGWTITISPQGKHLPGCDDLLWVVTPPYRSYNARYLDTSYGVTANEAVRLSPRDFRFVLNCADYARERERVDRVLWPSSYPEAEVKEATSKLGSSRLGKGRLWIRESKTRPAPKAAGGKNLGQIDWIKFDVELRVPPP